MWPYFTADCWLHIAVIIGAVLRGVLRGGIYRELKNIACLEAL
jgi:uncharacterized membrane protein